MSLDRLPNGRFPKGYTPQTRGRGVNKVTRDLREAGIEGAARQGSDGRGKGGLAGWMQMCAKKYPKDYLQFLGRLLPLTVKGDVGVSVTKVNIISVPNAHYIREDEIEAKEPLEGVLIGTPPERQPEPEPEEPAATDEASAELITFPARKTGD